MDKAIKRGLTDRIYERRKATALELEAVITDCLTTGDDERIAAIIDQLAREFAYDVHEPQSRYGGLIGLAAVSIALGQNDVPKYLNSIINPVLACFGDHDSHVRYYACEALYNIAKVAKGEILIYFNDIFDILCKLVADSDHSVKNGADILDRLIKDIVSEKATTYVSILELPNVETTKVLDKNGKLLQYYEPQSPKAFKLAKFIGLLKERIYATNTYTRLFIVSWLMLLESIPDLELISYLPSFLQPLFSYLSSSLKDVRVLTENFLKLLLQEIKRIYEIKRIALENKKRSETETDDNGQIDYIPGQDTVIDCLKIIDILVNNLESKEDSIRIISLQWLIDLLNISPESFTLLIPKLLGILLGIISDNPDLQNMAVDLNNRLMSLVATNNFDTNYTMIVKKLSVQLLDEKHTTKLTRLTCLSWLIMLQELNPQAFLSETNETFVLLLQVLNDPSDEVINKDLELVSKIANESSNEQFQLFMVDLIKLFKKDRKLLDNKADFILRHLYKSLNPQRVYESISKVLYEDEENLLFVAIMIQILNNNLIVAPELSSFREKLMQKTPESHELFKKLFKCWSLNSPSLLCLTLLTSNYQLGYKIVLSMSEYPLSLGLLVQIDLLIQLLESPMFVKLRLDLLHGKTSKWLYKCLYGLLMLIPQSTAFTTLKSRLECVGNGWAVLGDCEDEVAPESKLNASTHNLDSMALLDWFHKSQRKLLEYQNQQKSSLPVENEDLSSNMHKMNLGLPEKSFDWGEAPLETSSVIEGNI